MGQRMIHVQPLFDLAKTQISNYAFTAGTNVNTEPINNRLNNGFSAILLVQGTGSLDMDVNYQVSLDGEVWYTPRTTDGTGLTSVTSIVVAATQSEWIIFSPQVAPWVRFQLDPDGTGNWSAYYIHQEDAN